MDNLVLIQVAGDLSQRLSGAVLTEVREEDLHRFRFLFTHPAGPRSVVVSVRPERPWIGRPSCRWEGPRRMSRFAAGLQKALAGAVMEELVKPGPGRAVRLRFAHGFSLALELAVHNANILLLNREHRVEIALRTPASARERVGIGNLYREPPLPAGLPPVETASFREIRQALDRGMDLGLDPATALHRGLFGLGRTAAQAILQESASLGVPVEEHCRRRVDQVRAGKTVPFEGTAAGRLNLLPWTPEGTTLSENGAARIAGAFHERLDQEDRFRSRKEGVRSVLARELRRLEGLARRVQEDLLKFRDPERFRLQGEAILASLGEARRVGGSIFVPDPYDPERAIMEIPDRPGESLPAVADRAFGMHRRALRGEAAARKRRIELEGRLERLDRLLARLETLESLEEMVPFEADLRKEGLAIGLARPGRKSLAGALSARPRLEGVRVYPRERDRDLLIGKDGKSNARLTFKLAGPDDFWLHALGHRGAHVIIRNPERKSRLPEAVLAEAAAAAAWFSAAREQDQVDVQWTRRKYVRKVRKGAPGAVIVKKSETIRVRPKAPA